MDGRLARPLQGLRLASRLCRGDVFNRYGRKTGFARESVFCDALEEMHLTLAQYAAANGIPAEEMARRLSGERTASPRAFILDAPADAPAWPAVAARLPRCRPEPQSSAVASKMQDRKSGV